MLNTPILQFGTSRFLQAHADLFVSEALSRGEALGRITVVQTTDSPASTARLAALAEGYEVIVRGLRGGEPVEERQRVTSVQAALSTARDWPQLRAGFASGTVQVVLSNTGDAGYQGFDDDSAAQLGAAAAAPRGFPAKLLVLLHERWQRVPEAPLSLLPCELISRNGDTLRDIVSQLAQQWQLPTEFQAWLLAHPVWANSLVDRIVPEALSPAGAVAEPYALWAIERQPRLVLPCTHPAIVVTDALQEFERLKLWLLNLGHTLLAELWLRAGQPPGMTVLDAMRDLAWHRVLQGVWQDEVLPVFDALGEGPAARDYLVELRSRLLNPFVAHRLADIAQNHAVKKQRRLAPVVAEAQARLPGLAQPWLRAALHPPTQ
jgi:tagaturonate reductase